MSAKKDPKDRIGAEQCNICGEWFNRRNSVEHLTRCVSTNPSSYKEGENYVKCPECGICSTNLNLHMRKVHSWTEERFEIARSNGQRFQSESMKKATIETMKLKYGTEHHWKNPEVIEKRRQTWQRNHGCDNPFGSKSVQAKIITTNQERYGCDHPMQNEEVAIRQFNSAQNGPTDIEEFFDKHTCVNVVYTGGKSRFLRTKSGVKKGGRVIHDLNPDFMIFSDSVAEESVALIKDGKPLANRRKFSTKFVVELFGEHYHSEDMIGVSPQQHVEETIATYKSIGIECLVLWGKQILGGWEQNRSMIELWLNHAIQTMNARPERKERTSARVDARLAPHACPYGSGERFKTPEGLATWLVDPNNLYRQECIENLDYVVCRLCNRRFKKLSTHLKREHGVERSEYLLLHPDARVISIREKERIAAENSTKERKPKVYKHEGQEGVDYVVCTVCGYMAGNLKQHIRRRHGEDVLRHYQGSIKSTKAVETLRLAASKTWDTRGRSVARNVSENQTHKDHGLTKEIATVYLSDKLSWAAIAKKHGLTPEGVAYLCKKKWALK